MINYELLIKNAKESGISDIEIVETYDDKMEINYFNGSVETNEISNIKKINVHGIVNGQMAYLDLEDLDTDVNDIIKKIKENATHMNGKDEAIIFEGSKSYPEIKKEKADFSNVSIEDKIELLKKLNLVLRKLIKE